jgi:hypothetical protein
VCRAGNTPRFPAKYEAASPLDITISFYIGISEQSREAISAHRNLSKNPDPMCVQIMEFFERSELHIAWD